MPRSPCWRRIHGRPAVVLFKPAGVPARDVEETVLSLGEFEALRLADVEGLYQEAAAVQMQISRTTFGRIVENARRKVAGAVVHGRALRIGGGPVVEEPHLDPGRGRRCRRRRRGWGE